MVQTQRILISNNYNRKIMSTIKITQTSKDQFWFDESGTKIPFNRLTSVEKLHERLSSKLLKNAQTINKQLAEFKKTINEASKEAYEAFMQSKEANKESKGNFTWYNFNRTIKIEVAISERIEFDDLTIKAAKEKLDAFLDANIKSDNQFIKDMVLDAFETKRNKQLDVKKVLGLTSYKSRINDPLFSAAVDLISEAIRRPNSKAYFRIWLKDQEGKYSNIELNLSSI